MLLRNLLLPGESSPVDLLIENGHISSVTPAAASINPPATLSLSFENALVFPGLINSHDHIDFNLFPFIGNRIYRNYTEWGPDIHANNGAAIKAVLKVPKELRILWGIYKNLLNGFTTVVNHGEKLNTDTYLIHVFQDCYCLHSVGFEKNWRWKLNRPGATGKPFVLHIGEGTDRAATKEIDRLIRWNLFKRPLIGIHGVAMNERQAAGFRALIWCPASNQFLLRQTAPIDGLKSRVPILFGTDSTLTADWNAWTQIRLARRMGLTTDRELLAMLTTSPANAWGLHDRGEIRQGRIADLVIARPKPGQQGADALFGLDPEDLLLVMHAGNIRLFDSTLLQPLENLDMVTGDFHPIASGTKYVSGDLPGLMHEINRYYPDVRFPYTSG